MDKYYELVQLFYCKGEDVGDFLDNVILSGVYEKDELIFFLEEKLEFLKGFKKVLVK